MANTRKKIARIPFDDLELGRSVRVMWGSGDLFETQQGLFVRFDRIDGEYFLVMRVMERGQDRGEIQISTRAGLEVWNWEC